VGWRWLVLGAVRMPAKHQRWGSIRAVEKGAVLVGVSLGLVAFVAFILGVGFSTAQPLLSRLLENVGFACVVLLLADIALISRFGRRLRD
jgi:hypothetical protein